MRNPPKTENPPLPKNTHWEEGDELAGVPVYEISSAIRAALVEETNRICNSSPERELLQRTAGISPSRINHHLPNALHSMAVLASEVEANVGAARAGAVLTIVGTMLQRLGVTCCNLGADDLLEGTRPTQPPAPAAPDLGYFGT